MRNIDIVAKKMARNGLKIANLLGCAFHFESEFICTTPYNNKSKTKLSLLTPAPLFCPKSNEVRNIRMEPWLGAFRRSKTLPRRELSRLFLQK